MNHNSTSTTRQARRGRSPRAPRGFVGASVIAETFGFTLGEIRNFAIEEPVVLRSLRVGDLVIYSWADAFLVACVTSRIDYAPATDDEAEVA